MIGKVEISDGLGSTIEILKQAAYISTSKMLGGI